MSKKQVKEALPYVLSVLITILIAALLIWYTTPTENTLPEVYGVM
jgi:hypothetical protein